MNAFRIIFLKLHVQW